MKNITISQMFRLPTKSRRIQVNAEKKPKTSRRSKNCERLYQTAKSANYFLCYSWMVGNNSRFIFRGLDYSVGLERIQRPLTNGCNGSIIAPADPQR